MLDVLGLVVPLFGIILLGYFSARIASISIDGLAWLNFLLIYIALPALFYKILSATPLDNFQNFGFFLASTGVTLFIFVACFLIALWLRRTSSAVATVQALAGAYGNLGYLGPPLALGAFGPEAGVAVAFIFALENTMHFVLFPLLIAISGGGEKNSVFAVLALIARRVLIHPFIISIAVGLLAAYTQFDMPSAGDQLIDSLAGAAAPCALFAMGVTAALRPMKEKPIALSYLIPIKLIVHPLLMYWVLSAFSGVPDVWVYTAVLLAALPTATNVFVLAQQYQTWEEQTSSVVVVSTAVSLFTLTALLYLFGAGST